MDPGSRYPDQYTSAGTPLRRMTTVPAQRPPPQPPHLLPHRSITEPTQSNTSPLWTQPQRRYSIFNPPPPIPSTFQPDNDNTSPQAHTMQPVPAHHQMHTFPMSHPAPQPNPAVSPSGQGASFHPFNQPYGSQHRQGQTSLYPQFAQAYPPNWPPQPTSHLQRASTFHVPSSRPQDHSPVPPPPPLPPKEFAFHTQTLEHPAPPLPPAQLEGLNTTGAGTSAQNGMHQLGSPANDQLPAPADQVMEPIGEEVDDELEEALRQSEAMYQAEQHQIEDSQDDEELFERILALSLAEEENRRQLERDFELVTANVGSSSFATHQSDASTSIIAQDTYSTNSAGEWEEYDAAAFDEPQPLVHSESSLNDPIRSSSPEAAAPEDEYSTKRTDSSLSSASEDVPQYTEMADSRSSTPGSLRTVQPVAPPTSESRVDDEMGSLEGTLPAYQDVMVPNGSQSPVGAFSMSAPIPSISLPNPTPDVYSPSAPVTPINGFSSLSRHGSSSDLQDWSDPSIKPKFQPPQSPGVSQLTLPPQSSPHPTGPVDVSYSPPSSGVSTTPSGLFGIETPTKPSVNTDSIPARVAANSPLPSVEVPTASNPSNPTSPSSFGAGSSGLVSGETILEDDWRNVSFGRSSPTSDNPALAPPPPFPAVVSLSPDAAFHICTPDWRSLPRLLGRLGNNRVEASPEAFNKLQLNTMYLRLIIHFQKNSIGGGWRTVLWLDLDRPISTTVSATEAAKFATSDTTQLPYGHRIPDPAVTRAASSPEITSATNSIVFVLQKPHILLPTTLSDVAALLTTVLGESKRASTSSAEGTASLKRLHKAIDKCYPSSKSKSKMEKGGSMKVVGKRTLGGWVGNLVAGVSKPKEAKGGQHGNDDVFEVVTPFAMPSDY